MIVEFDLRIYIKNLRFRFDIKMRAPLDAAPFFAVQFVGLTVWMAQHCIVLVIDDGSTPNDWNKKSRLLSAF